MGPCSGSMAARAGYALDARTRVVDEEGRVMCAALWREHDLVRDPYLSLSVA